MRDTAIFSNTGAAAFDEAFDAAGNVRPLYRQAFDHFAAIGRDGMESLQYSADLSMLNQGVTFTVYSDARGTEKIFPFDLMPRILTDAEWSAIEAGVAQRMVALNLFLEDIYHERKILRDRVVPSSLVLASSRR